MIQLSDQQQAAIDHVGSPVLVAAGAGSGKTRTLVAKFAQLIQSGLDPTRILAITFTNKAANEMKNRLVETLDIQKKDLPWVRTYHSACINILRKHCDLVGLNNPIQIYTNYQQKKLVQKLLKKLNLDKKNTTLILTQISNAKNTGSPENYLNLQSKFSPIPFTEIYKLYEKTLSHRNAVDFDSILYLTRNLLLNNIEIRRIYRTFFQYILCDEYQDTNNLNEEITDLLTKKNNFFAVGDDWQSIYSFRMSNIDHFLSFLKKYPKARVFRLEENYRSANEIVQLGNQIISFNKGRMKKKCYSKKEGGIIEILNFYNDSEEANWVVKKIKTMKTLGISYEKIAILYRTKFCSLPFEQALRKNNIPYHMLGGRGFFERMEVMDLNSYLAAAIFDKDDTSFERIVNTPRRGLGPSTLKKMLQNYKENTSLKQAAHKAIVEKILPPKQHVALKTFLNLLNKIKCMTPEEAIKHVLADTNYIKYLENYTKSNSMNITARIENIEQLIYSSSQKNTISSYLEEAALIKEDKEEKNDNGINLSTVHRAKGLEFKIVFVIGCEEQLFPHWKAMNHDKDIEEERRLMYVAVTRAEECLFITSASFRKGQTNTRSRFLNELENI